MAKGQGRSPNQRLKLFYLLDYLKENTDEEHTAKTPQIVEHLNNIGIPIERKTDVSDIHLLEEYGFEIEYLDDIKGTLSELRIIYRYNKRMFELLGIRD